jgi:hypothetical protein
MTTTLPPPAPVTAPKRRQRRGWWTAGIVVAAVAAVGITSAATGSDSTVSAEVASANPGRASTSSNTDIDVMAMDYAWQTNSAELCASYEDVRDVPNIDNYAVTKYEQGYGHKLSAVGRAHLIHLLHSC